jgi:hypothetical protein
MTSSTPRSARTELLTRLLEAYERSSSFATPGPWRRDVILKLDSATFPAAFAPDGRERRAHLLTAAAELESQGCARLVRHDRGPLAGEPKELRLGPHELDPAYASAMDFGFEPLATGLAELQRAARRLAAETATESERSFLEALALAAPAGDLSPIGMGRARFKQEWRSLLPALTAASALLRGIAPAWERVVSERLFRDSKLLGRVRHHVISLLVRMDPRWDGVPPEEAGDLLEAYGVRRKPGLIRCAGAGVLRIGGREYRLEDFVPVAHLPDAWSAAWAEALAGQGVRLVTTIENEFPFLSYVEEAGGPEGLGARRELAVYTAGFPTPALVAALAGLRDRAPAAEFRHWGDADLGGLRIWWLLRCRLEQPVTLFRTTAGWLKAQQTTGGQPFSAAEVDALQRLRSQLQPLAGEDIRGAVDLIDELLRSRIKLEQERY